MEKLKNLSLRKTIVLYMVINLVVTFFLSAVIIKIAEQTQEEIWWHYVDKEKYFEIAGNGGRDYLIDIPRPYSGVMTHLDYTISELCDFLETYTLLILPIIGSCIAVWMFYRDKLKIPIAELKQASQNISENNLDFQITYANRDEMGELCYEFERMRSQLSQNNQQLWRTIEEEKTLKAAIAHDLRSPLAVLKGYQEMMIEYLPDGTINLEKTMEMLTAGMIQIERMNLFLETMQKMNSLDKRELLSNEMTAEQLKQEIQSELDIFEKTSGKLLVLNVDESEERFFGDKEIILEVMENLLSNAFRYAKERVEIYVQVSAFELKISVSDDGSGFEKDSEEVTKAFYQHNMKDSLKHTGLGMYISRLYCEKHGGKLLVENNKNTGAVVTAIFRRIV